MARMTITEALAELKTLRKRVEKKRGTISEFIARPNRVKDPLESEGGARAYIQRERQAAHDLTTRMVQIRVAIQRANLDTPVTVCGTTNSVAFWLAWRRDAEGLERSILDGMEHTIRAVRQQVSSRQTPVRVVDDEAKAAPDDIVIEVNEAALHEASEKHTEVMGALDGALSLINATTYVEIPD